LLSLEPRSATPGANNKSAGGDNATMKHTPLFDVHMRTATNVINLKGVARPLEYVGHLEEHRAIRERVSLCDVWHLGEIEIEGKDALALVQKLITNDAARLSVNQCLYTVMCDEHGYIIDDLVCFRLAEQRFLWVVNVPKTDIDFQWVIKHAQGMDVSVRNLSSELALLALQGPYASEVLQRITETDLSMMSYYWCAQTVISTQTTEVPCIISRTGYTGERGFEICVSRDLATLVWNELLLVGRPLGIVPHGVAARESTRTEAGYLLNGNDMDEKTYPYEVGVGWVVKLSKDFVGKQALLRVRESGVERKLIGLEIRPPHTMRFGYPIYKDGRRIGHVTSGPLSPALLNRDASLGLGFVAAEHSAVGSELEIEIRGRRIPSRVVSTPFCKLRVKDDARVETYSPYALRFTPAHVWVKRESEGVCTVGITDFCQRDLGEALFAELPRVGSRAVAGTALGWVDTYRKPFELIAPLSGTVVEANAAVTRRPNHINMFPYARAGLVQIRAANQREYDQLLSYRDYLQRVRELQRYENWAKDQRTT
jgi:aminomethyltransferase